MLSKQVELLLQRCRDMNLKLRTAESCTAGGLAAAIASVAGASDVLDRGWVTYSNQAKVDELGVSEDILNESGAVSEPVVCAMAQAGVEKGYQTEYQSACVAISGVAGPGGGTVEKPVGTVWMAVCVSNQHLVSEQFYFHGSRSDIQQQAVTAAIHFLLRELRAT